MAVDQQTRAVGGAGPPEAPIWRLSVAQYHQMVRAGILTDDDPVELLEGLLVIKMPKNPPHRLATQLVRDALAAAAPAGWFVDAQEPITLADSEPEPDVAVLRGDRRSFHDRHPGPEDVGLVVEVADATLQRDRTLKQRLYAAAGIGAYWIVNLVEGQIEVYSEPSGPAAEPRYAGRRDYLRGETIPLALAGQAVAELAVQALLP